MLSQRCHVNVEQLSPGVRWQLGQLLLCLSHGARRNQIFHCVFSDNDRQRLLRGELPGLTIIDDWAVLRRLHPYSALVDLAWRTKVINEIDHKWLVASLEMAFRVLGSSTNAERDRSRRMVRTELQGQHTHATLCGTNVHVFKRDGKYIARGRYEGNAFGETLGSDPDQAVAHLRRVLIEIEEGRYVPPAERRRRPLQRRSVPKLSARELCDDFVAEIRKTKGRETANTYQGRLTPLIEFAELHRSRQRWPLAMNCDRDFAIAFKAYLASRKITRNGRAGAPEKLMAPGQVFNVLQCCRTLFNWARRPDVNRLPSEFVNPMTKHVVGTKPRKDPFRPPTFPMDRRIELIRKMDAWQLKHLSLSFVFAIRAEDSDGLVISEVDWQNRCLNFGSRFSGSDFNKGVVSFHLPFPLELARIVRACVAGRAEGPLLRTRTVCEGNESRKLHVGSADDLVRLIKDAFSSARQDEVQSAQDQKRIVRKTLRKMGGLRQGELRREFKRLLKAADINTDGRYYDVKGSVTTDMNSAGLSHLMLRYVTGHTTRDILNEYVSLDCEKEMQNYFDYIQPLLTAIMTRADELGLPRIG